MEKNFRLLEKDPEVLIHLKIQHLEQLRFFESKEEVIRRYDEAKSDQPNQLELDLSFSECSSGKRIGLDSRNSQPR